MSLTSTKILIIEDHDDFRELIKVYLKEQNLNFQILEASSAEAGILIALQEKPQIILMDIRLPEMHGMDAASRIKKDLPECNIIVLTMFETPAFKKIFKSNDIVAYIGKSEVYEKLIPQINRILSERN